MTTAVDARSSAPINITSPISQLATTAAGAVAGGLVGVGSARLLGRGGVVAAALGLGAAALGGVVGARLGADMPAPRDTGIAVGLGAAAGIALTALTRVPGSIAIGGGLAAGVAAGRVLGPEQAAPLETVGNVDLERYAGKWYEVARIPTPFQDDSTVSTAEYTVRGDGTVGVRNTSLRDGATTASIDGQAEPLPGRTDRLNVGFGGALRLIPKADEGNYWVLGLEDDYSLALVGSPGRDTLFMLARDPDAYSSPQAKAMLEQARADGYDVDSMLVADWDTQTTRPAAAAD
jgi:apolipoprotein D and lipocalin family protein